MSSIGSISGMSVPPGVQRVKSLSGGSPFRYYPVLKRGRTPPSGPGVYRVSGKGGFIQEPNDLQARMQKMVDDGEITSPDDYFDFIVAPKLSKG